MSDLLDRLQDMVAFKHDDMSVAQKAIDHIEAQAARIAELEAALNQAKQHFVADEPLKAFVEVCLALEGGKDA